MTNQAPTVIRRAVGTTAPQKTGAIVRFYQPFNNQLSTYLDIDLLASACC